MARLLLLLQLRLQVLHPPLVSILTRPAPALSLVLSQHPRNQRLTIPATNLIMRVSVMEQCISLALNLMPVMSIPSLLPPAVTLVVITPPMTLIQVQTWGAATPLRTWGASSLISMPQHHPPCQDLRHKLRSSSLAAFKPCVFPRKCKPFSIIPLCIQSHRLPHSTATAYPFWSQTQRPQTTCYLTSPPSYHTIQWKVDAYAWGITPSLPSWAMVQQLSLSMERRYSSEIASTSLTSTTCYTVFKLINDSVGAELLAYMAWACTSSSLRSSLRWTPQPTAIYNMLPWVGLPPWLTSIMSNQNFSKTAPLLPQYLSQLQLNLKMTLTFPPTLLTIQRSHLHHQLQFTISDLPPPEYSVSLKDLDKEELIQWLYLLEHAPNSGTGKAVSAPIPLECMTQENIINKLHRPNSILPPIRPCDTSNPSKTKSHWTAEELYCITGCPCFRNYWHLVAASKDGTFIDTGEFCLNRHICHYS
jgi:hypothetical protein